MRITEEGIEKAAELIAAKVKKSIEGAAIILGHNHVEVHQSRVDSIRRGAKHIIESCCENN